MLRNRVMMVVALLVLSSMVLAACQPKATPTPEPVVTTAPETPAEPVGRTGAWVDEIVFTEISDANSGIAQLAAGEIDVYNYAIAGNAALLRTALENPDLKVVYSFGGWREIAFNTAVFTDTTRLNPFSNPKIREAMNYVVDRQYIATELQGGTASPKLMPLNSSFADYARYADLARALEAKYAYNFDYGKSIVDAEMVAMGAVLDPATGKWTYNGQPLVLVALIRQEWAVSWGNYYCDQLEKMGFTVDRQVKVSRDAAAVWRSTAAADGLWNIYTSGWLTTAIVRDQGYTWGYFQTPILPYPYTQAYTPDPVFEEVAMKLYNNEFLTMDERRAMFAQVMDLGLKDSARVYLMDDLSFTALRTNVQVAYDLAGGVQGSAIAPYTIRFEGQEGGTIRMGMPTVLNDPWNPVGGSNFIYDRVIQRHASDSATLPDPYTGLAWPQRIVGAEVVAQTGLPVAKTLDWIDLRFEDTIAVPADVWVDWDAANQRFITAAEKWPEGTTALTKSTVYYPEDLWEITWHDGSNLSPADFVMAMIMGFDPAKPESPIYDENTVPNLEAFLETFKGVRIVSTDPLIIETYSDSPQLDAELSISTWWPNYGYGEAPWHTIAASWKAEATNELAYTSGKSTDLEVEWMNFIDGPSLAILKAKLDEAAAENFVPYTFLSQYMGADEVATRYANLQNWYATYGHFWIGTGPFFIDKVYSVENTVTITRYESYADPASKWGGFGEPKVPVVDVTGPAEVKIGQPATFDVSVTFEGAAYPANEIVSASYLLYGPTGALLSTGIATLVADGQYQVVLDAAATGALAAGASKIEVVVVSLLVSIPQFTQVQFVVAP